MEMPSKLLLEIEDRKPNLTHYEKSNNTHHGHCLHSFVLQR